ncbi:type II toxin-antitoxin system VapC family toxin [Candidatus Gottesmanbacteria bacterium]|nr:type II toxin-antitoxin system VapC family toxin [Candidatus Gottesmanbacteria bacterium]MBI5452075.1 type II toxin-antitoxin system VapC family toxin [Candidatus Gottesmanbacteria bacterium]
MIFLDTNTLVRFFTNDDKIKVAKVKSLLENEKVIYVSDVVFPEIEYVLSNFYNTSRDSIITAFQFIASLQNIKLPKYMKIAIAFYEKTKLDMADCIIAAESLKGRLASFDEKLLKTPGVKGYW